ncbi:hypothetical protein COV16_07115 [Candidatus Woesearchaeota archaeon CG10_big_fil_rev_8_21_14_0_10_34_8]|nr:MAG: hypothetical protein COV16_07115 [Candidatus Woesearchaeota archaeon CG10_big_fil_rev_8_21_14_0_10_34_8]
MVVRGKTNEQGRVGHSGKGEASAANFRKAVGGAGSTARRSRGTGMTRGGLASVTGRGKKSRK